MLCIDPFSLLPIMPYSEMPIAMVKISWNAQKNFLEKCTFLFFFTRKNFLKSRNFLKTDISAYTGDASKFASVHHPLLYTRLKIPLSHNFFLKSKLHPRRPLEIDSNAWWNTDKRVYYRIVLIADLRTCLETNEIENDQLQTQQNSYSASHLLDTVTTQWLDSNCVVTVLPAVNNDDYTITVQSPCSHCA